MLLRPHDVLLSLTPQEAGAAEGSISRVLRVGFEVRVTVLTDDGDEVNVLLTRTHARQLGLEPGVRVWVSAASGATTVPAFSAAVG